MKKIGILTSGGDSPGMNPAILSVVRTAKSRGIQVVGIKNGYEGIFSGELTRLDDRALRGVLERGGTVLQSSRCKKFYEEAGILQAVDNLKQFGISALVVIGGDGSLTGARALHRHGISVIGIPGSIDNDLYGTEMCVGVDTAANTITDLIDKIKDTARSHRRCFLVEVMGRGSGYLALTTAITSGADVAVIPEYRPNVARIVQRLADRYETASDNTLIILSEGVCDANEFIRRMEEAAGDTPLRQEVRTTVLGHVQRGGIPTHFDRLLSSRMGEMAVIGLLAGESGMVTSLVKGRVTLVDLDTVLGKKKHPTPDLIRLARHLEIEFGDPVEM